VFVCASQSVMCCSVHSVFVCALPQGTVFDCTLSPWQAARIALISKCHGGRAHVCTSTMHLKCSFIVDINKLHVSPFYRLLLATGQYFRFYL